MVNLRHSLANGKLYLERTSETLRDLVKNPRLNTQRQIDLFNQEMVELERVAQEVRDINLDMQTNTSNYFDSWNNEVAQIQNPEITAAGQKRIEESQKVMSEILVKMEQAKSNIGPYISDLRDIQRYLQKDQTADGVMALKPAIDKTLNRENVALQELNQIINAIDKITLSVE
ncbi:MAG: DUF2959 family protein [Candidatus Auribacterota bacterium]